MPAKKSRGTSAKRTGKKEVRPLPPAQIPRALTRFAAPAGTDRYAAGKALTITAEKNPAALYPHFDTLAPFLSSAAKIIRWNAQHILSALAPVDTLHKIDPLLDTYIAFITGTNMISAANSIRALGRIAQFRPDLLPRILPAILQVESAAYETPECRNVAIAHTLDVLQSLWPAVQNDPAVRAFILRQHANTRPAAARRARTLIP